VCGVKTRFAPREISICRRNAIFETLDGGAVGDRFVIPKFDVVLLRAEAVEPRQLGDEQSVIEAAR
jgi:hypothetical protein